MTEDLPDKPTQVVQDRVPAWAEYLLLAALPYLLYGHTLFYGLLGIDDTLYYFGNPALSEGRLEGLGRIFTTYYYSDYFPVTQFTLWLDVALFGTQSWFFARVHELAWFAAGVLAVRKLAGELVESRGLAFSVALLFALHPAGTSTAVWLAERKNVVGFALSFAALACYVSGRRKEGRESQARLAGAWVLLALALLAKTHAVAVPAMMFVYELTRGHGAWTRRLLVWFPFALLGATLVALSLTVFRNDLQQPPLGGSRAAALFAAGPILARYLAHTVAPFNLAFYYAVDEPGFESGYAWALWLAALGGPALLTLLSRPRGAVACGWLLGFAALLPALNLVPQPVPMSDHYHWWALPGWLLALAAALESAYTRGRRSGLGAGCPRGLRWRSRASRCWPFSRACCTASPRSCSSRRPSASRNRPGRTRPTRAG
ncbi:MAG: hypothetical protein M5U26_16625 [Planctomycetota bacterium]|nr:hypothetical protein [Planctomycetota bacterium]